METIKIEIEKRFKNPPAREKIQIHSSAHALAEEISKSFGESKKFGLYLGIIKRIGEFEARKKFRDVMMNAGLKKDEKIKIFMAASRNQKNGPI